MVVFRSQRTRGYWTVAAAGLAVIAGVSAWAASGESGRIAILPNQVPWKPAPATLPPDTFMAVLEGDPKSDGIFTVRMQVPAGFRLPAHTHPMPERVTVLEGSVRVGIQGTPTETVGEAFPAGSYYVTPPGVVHTVWSEGGALLQLTGHGPWEVRLVGKP